METIISEILEMCSYDKNYVRKLVDQLTDLCDRTNDNFEEETLEQYLIEFYDEDFETLYEEYVCVKNEEEARAYAKSMALQVNTDDYKISIRNVKDI